MNLNDLLDKIDTIEYRLEGRVSFNVIVTDSRRASPEGLFFAISGLNKNGNDYIEQAIDRGVVAIISEQPMGKNFPINFIQVKNVRIALAKISKLFYACPDEELRVIGITGTNGKTTVSMLTQHLMGGSESVGLIGTIRYDIGKRTLPSHRTTPESVDCYSLLSNMVKSNCSDVVMEVSSHGIHQKRVNFIQMESVVFLNLSRDHIDYHKTMEEYFLVKKQLFSNDLSTNAKRSIINGDCPYGKRLISSLEPSSKLLTFGLAKGLDIRATNLKLSSHCTEFILHYPEGKIKISYKLLGRHNIYNVLAAISIAYSHGIEFDKILLRLNTFKGVPGRMEPLIVGQNFMVIVDYAHTSDAIEHACEMVNELTKKKKIIVFGCGGNRDKGKRSLMMRAAIDGANLIIATADNPRFESIDDIFKDMKCAIRSELEVDRIRFIKDRKQAISYALKSAEPGDCVLITGKGHEMYQEVEGTMMPFDDRKVGRELLKNCINLKT